MEYVWFALILAVIVITLLATWRFITLRSKGTPVLLRKMPAGRSRLEARCDPLRR